MISIGTVKFDFRTGNEAFAQSLYARWDRFFQASFEAVAEEVMSRYDLVNEVLMIDSLPIELPVLSEENFEESFPQLLREALHDYFRRLLVGGGDSVASAGVRRIPVGQSALDVLCFFLLHGYLPFSVDDTQNDVGQLLEQVLRMAPDEFRQFLERYAHYDFLYKRLVYQFDDEQLEVIAGKVHPSEAKFIHLYTRIQIRTYRLNPVSEISYSDYRNAVWILVLAYLFHEGGGRFNKKQLVIHTLRGLSARFNLPFVVLARMLSDKLDELEKNTANLPELWSILKEIRADIHGELLALDGNYLRYAYREVVEALRAGNRKEAAYLLAPENLSPLLSDPGSCREFLRPLSEKEIYRLVACVIPQESEFIITYARLLDRHEERGYFRGKAGSDFRLIKWEFIFAVIYRAPLSFFSRTQFVLQVTQRLAAHYNLIADEVIRFLLADEALHDLLVSLKLLPILTEILPGRKRPVPVEVPDLYEDLNAGSYHRLITILSYAPSAKRFIKGHTEREIHRVIRQLIPVESDFILSYAQLLGKYSDKGLLEGRAGSDFRILKWEFIFSCLLVGEKVAYFHRKYFVYDVIKQLAAHYNQQVIDLLGYFYRVFASSEIPLPYVALVQVLNELYHESLLTVSTPSSVARMGKEAAEQWIVYLFGAYRPYGTTGWSTLTLSRHLADLLEKQNDVFRALWKSGKLDESLIFSVLRRDEKLQRLWIRSIGDIRLLEVYRVWMRRYLDLRRQFPDMVFLQTAASYLSLWIVQLTARRYASWSATEIEHFLTDRFRRAVPEGMAGVLNDINFNSKNIHLKQIVEMMNVDLLNTEIPDKSVSVTNAGVVLFYPFCRTLFKRIDLIGTDSGRLKDEEAQLKAIFLLQYIVYGSFKSRFEEHELAFNKILVSWAGGPLPKEYDLTDEDKKNVEDMFTGVRGYWSKLKGTSHDTLRQAFCQRQGVIRFLDEENRFILEVEEKPYDLLLDSLPWAIGVQRLLNSDKLLFVKWRNR